jgi:hypothetical protein
MKTLNDLNQYTHQVAAIVKTRQQEARRRRLAARPVREAAPQAPTAAVGAPGPGPTVSTPPPHAPVRPIR